MISNDHLTLKASKDEVEKSEGSVKRERIQMYQTIRLPIDADPNTIQAKLDNGILNVTLGKLPQAESSHVKHIKIH